MINSNSGHRTGLPQQELRPDASFGEAARLSSCQNPLATGSPVWSSDGLVMPMSAGLVPGLRTGPQTQVTHFNHRLAYGHQGMNTPRGAAGTTGARNAVNPQGMVLAGQNHAQQVNVGIKGFAGYPSSAVALRRAGVRDEVEQVSATELLHQNAQRSGKWTLEEEEYAKRIVLYFRSGKLNLQVSSQKSHRDGAYQQVPSPMHQPLTYLYLQSKKRCLPSSKAHFLTCAFLRSRMGQLCGLSWPRPSLARRCESLRSFRPGPTPTKSFLVSATSVPQPIKENTIAHVLCGWLQGNVFTET